MSAKIHKRQKVIRKPLLYKRPENLGRQSNEKLIEYLKVFPEDSCVWREVESRMVDPRSKVMPGEKLSPTLEYLIGDLTVDNDMLASFMFRDEPKNYINSYKIVRLAVSLLVCMHQFRASRNHKMFDLIGKWLFSVESMMSKEEYDKYNEYERALSRKKSRKMIELVKCEEEND